MMRISVLLHPQISDMSFAVSPKHKRLRCVYSANLAIQGLYYLAVCKIPLLTRSFFVRFRGVRSRLAEETGVDTDLDLSQQSASSQRSLGSSVASPGRKRLR